MGWNRSLVKKLEKIDDAVSTRIGFHLCQSLALRAQVPTSKHSVSLCQVILIKITKNKYLPDILRPS